MTPSREEALFALALEKPVEKRPTFLDAVCEGGTALRARLEALLAAYEQPETLRATQAETALPTINQARPRWRSRGLGPDAGTLEAFGALG